MYRIAVPTKNDFLFKHFGQSKEFTIFEIDDKQKQIMTTTKIGREEGEHCFPHGLLEKNIHLIIAGNIGENAIGKIKAQNIDVIAGAKYKNSYDLVIDYLNGKLETTEVKCNHMGCQHHNNRTAPNT